MGGGPASVRSIHQPSTFTLRSHLYFRRTTDENLDLVRHPWHRQILRQCIVSYKTRKSLPTLFRFLNDVLYAKLFRFPLYHVVEGFFQQNVLLSDIGEEKSDFGLVLRVGVDRLHELIHWGWENRNRESMNKAEMGYEYNDRWERISYGCAEREERGEKKTD